MVLSLLFLVFFLCFGSTTHAASRLEHSVVLTQSGKLAQGKLAPDFAGIDLSLGGTNVLALSDIFKQSPNRVTVVFFSTTCLPCRVGLLELRKHATSLAAEQHRILLVAVGETREVVRAYLQKLGLEFPCVWDRSGKISMNYGVIPLGGDFSQARVPLTAVLDSRGHLIKVITEEGLDYISLLRN